MRFFAFFEFSNFRVFVLGLFFLNFSNFRIFDFSGETLPYSRNKHVTKKNATVYICSMIFVIIFVLERDVNSIKPKRKSLGGCQLHQTEKGTFF